ncbi:MAG: ABC transporter ATP-binding protein/permease [Roseimicrobium sp.]
MTEAQPHMQPPSWEYFLKAAQSFARSEKRFKAAGLLLSLVVLMLGINGLNVINSYVGRDFMSAIEARDHPAFVRYAWMFASVFGISTVVAVLFRFVEERLALLWREWQTTRLLEHYLENRVYMRLHKSCTVKNPDQNIAEDVKAFTTTTLSFLVMMLNGVFTAIAFSTVLISISPLLFGVAVVYAIVGSLLTVLLGQPLIGLNYRQLDREAEFRGELVHVKENSEHIALLRREGRIRAELLARLKSLVLNWRRVIAVNRNLGFFTTGYNYMIQLIPALFVAPLFFSREVEFGVITQSAMAFAQLLGALSLIVTQFQSISNYTAVFSRLGTLVEEMHRVALANDTLIEVCMECNFLGYQQLTLRAPTDGTVLVRELSVRIAYGKNLLIDGHYEPAKIALFRATAGMWEAGEGKVIRPDVNDIAFITERPYLHRGTLREVLVHTGNELKIGDAAILDALKLMDLEDMVERAGGLDEPQDWTEMLSLGAQQLLVVARLLISGERFAVLDRIATALNPDEMQRVIAALRSRGQSVLTFGNSTDNFGDYDAVLDLCEDGSQLWRKGGPESLV